MVLFYPIYFLNVKCFSHKIYKKMFLFYFLIDFFDNFPVFSRFHSLYRLKVYFYSRKQ